MKVSKKSWHYRLHNAVISLYVFCHDGPEGPWRFITGERTNHAPKSLCGYFWSTLVLTLFLPVFVLFFAIAVAIVFGVVVPLSRLWATYRHFRPKKVATGDPLVRTWVKARKAKVCPQIELV